MNTEKENLNLEFEVLNFYVDLAKKIKNTFPTTSSQIEKLYDDEVKHHEAINNQVYFKNKITPFEKKMFEDSNKKLTEIIKKGKTLLEKTDPSQLEILETITNVETYEAEGLYWLIRSNNNSKKQQEVIKKEMQKHIRPLLDEALRLEAYELERKIVRNFKHEYDILVIDDDPTTLVSASKLLQKDYRLSIQNAKNCKEGFEKLLAVQYDVILSDILMTNLNQDEVSIDGNQLYSILKSIDYKASFVAMSTSYEQKMYYEKEKIPFIQKPFNGFELLTTIRGLLLDYSP